MYASFEDTAHDASLKNTKNVFGVVEYSGLHNFEILTRGKSSIEYPCLRSKVYNSKRQDKFETN